MDLPDYIEQETWDAFEAKRKQMKFPLDDFTRKRVLKKLEGFHCQGYVADEMLAEAVERNWRTVFMYPDAPRRPQTQQEKQALGKIANLVGRIGK